MTAKPVIFSAHARFEMRRRGIKQAEVLEVVRKPGQIIASENGRQIHQSKISRDGKFLLRVVVAEDDQSFHVVTAYKTSRIERYWNDK
ncbi:MAG: DUF4258 domain-containing protein [Planctomycetaceae bacterium]